MVLPWKSRKSSSHQRISRAWDSLNTCRCQEGTKPPVTLSTCVHCHMTLTDPLYWISVWEYWSAHQVLILCHAYFLSELWCLVYFCLTCVLMSWTYLVSYFWSWTQHSIIYNAALELNEKMCSLNTSYCHIISWGINRLVRCTVTYVPWSYKAISFLTGKASVFRTYRRIYLFLI